MIFAERGNKVKQISESDIDKYVNQGFKIVDERGTLIQDTIPTDLTTLKTAYANSTKQISQLKAEIESLRKELADKDNQLGKLKAALDQAKANENNAKSIVSEPAPKKSRKKTDVTADETPVE